MLEVIRIGTDFKNLTTSYPAEDLDNQRILLFQKHLHCLHLDDHPFEHCPCGSVSNSLRGMLLDFFRKFLDRIKKRDFLVNYQVRVSSRAKYVRFHIKPGVGLEVVVPKGYRTSKIPKLLWAKEDWIQSHYKEIKRAEAQVASAECLPEYIFLEAINQTFSVTYKPDPSKPHSLQIPSPEKICLLADPRREAALCCALLQTWLKEKARECLVPWAQTMAKQYGFPLQRVQIRLQKTRWGSMSTSGTLSLNCQIMFLRPPLVHHILLHELCHIRHPNHGPQFKALLSQFSSNAAHHEKELRQIRIESLPIWARV